MTRQATHGRRVLSMAGGTATSRLTGLLRVLVLAWVLGFTPLADAFNLANTIPNMLFDLVIGGVLGATFIPVIVERLAIDGERRAWRSISTVVTASVMVMAVACLAAWFAAPWIIDGFTFLQHTSDAKQTRDLIAQRHVATQFLRWFVPQIFFYGVIGIATALLNIRRVFAVGSWAPVANNIICIGVLVWFHLVDPTPSVTSVGDTHNLMWLGLGTTAGVAVQFAVMWPSLATSDLGRLRFRFDVRDPALRTVGRLGSWTLLVVIANQASLYVLLIFAFGTGGNGPVSAYTYGWSFMQMPYAIVVVSVLGVLTPQLAQFATEADYESLGERLSFGLRQSLVIIIPCTVALIILAQPVVGILLNHLDASTQLPAGTVLAILAAGLPGFTIFQLCIRGLQSMQRMTDVFALYALQNAVTIALCVVLGRHSLAGLTASVSIAYGGAAVAALIVLAARQVPVAATIWSVHVRRSVLASLAMGVVMAAAWATPTWTRGGGLVARGLFATILGGATYVLFVLVAQRHARPRVQS
ncbi:MAG: murein biosynthesis integral membrane protein MurJ [Acidobacteria bacterium]|nr:murein biosynthesis integral membrane protein MurJ [Acidobacteriota bacterium]